ncbi:dihydrofolate reductase [Candidatus Saccharibacteria bacterium]|nr:dihydrofolate reductase [Candidatus Saccharibacteria bacterium]
MFSIIAAIGKNREIGKNNRLIFHLKDDVEFFKNTTLGHKVVMGLNTWNSLPGKLQNRQNIVISPVDLTGPDLVVKDLKQFIADYTDTDEEIFIIGGGMIYQAFLPYAKNLYLTEISATDPSATVFFPKFNKSKYDKIVLKEGLQDDLSFKIVRYYKKF